MRSFMLVIFACVLLLFSCKKTSESKMLAGNATACFTVPRDTFYVGDTILFTNCSINTDSFLYSFGDGTVSRDSNPSHIFSQRGTYSVSLRASNQSSANVTSRMIIIKAGVPSGLPWRYFAPGSNTDSMVFLGTGNGNFLVWGYRIVLSGLKLPGNFTDKDSFVFRNNCCGINYSGKGYFSYGDSIVDMSYSYIVPDPNGNPQVGSGSFYGVRR